MSTWKKAIPWNRNSGWQGVYYLAFAQKESVLTGVWTLRAVDRTSVGLLPVARELIGCVLMEITSWSSAAPLTWALLGFECMGLEFFFYFNLLFKLKIDVFLIQYTPTTVPLPAGQTAWFLDNLLILKMIQSFWFPAPTQQLATIDNSYSKRSNILFRPVWVTHTHMNELIGR